ncbi:MAG TPA: diguanylate cyclase [Rhodocyclaceae bacterium]|nr:diguanylate cyclase [Rhodocyclaceae bacterium]
MKALDILLADDSQSTGAFLAEYLRSNGHRVTLVESGEEAVETYAKHVFDLVLMDIVMPGIGGLEAVSRIKAIPRTTWIPVIIITGLDAEGDILNGFMAGADDYMVKPVTPIILDIRIRSMLRISAIQRSASAVIDNVIEGIVQIDRVGRIGRFNKAAESIFGYTEAEVMGRNVNMLMPSPYREDHDEYIARYVATGRASVIGIGRIVTGLRKNGESFPMHLGVTEAATPDGGFFIGLVRDMTTEERMRRQIEYLATHDALTGLPNRNECWKRLDARYSLRDDRHGPAECSVFYCDLDGFKQVNDQYGHAAGDAVLKETARRLTEVLFVRDFIARIGGDEFLAIVDGELDDAKATALARRMIEVVGTPVVAPEGQFRIGVSIGIAHSREHPDSVEALVNSADGAMYAAKRGGKGGVAVATR